MASDLSALSDLSEKGRVISGKDSIYRAATPALLLIYIKSIKEHKSIYYGNMGCILKYIVYLGIDSNVYIIFSE